MTLNPFILRAEERLREWRYFKKSLTDSKSDLEHLQMVADWWAQCPVNKKYIDWQNLNEWPNNPWEMIHYNDLCASAVALGMEQTLWQSDSRWTPERLTLNLIDDDGYDTYLILAVDSQYILNYNLNTVDTFESIGPDVKFIETFQFDGQNHNKM